VTAWRGREPETPSDLVGLVGRPGLDPGTLGLKVLARALRRGALCCTLLQNRWWEGRVVEGHCGGVTWGETQCNEVVGTDPLKLARVVRIRQARGLNSVLLV
jgi:hypothetical protein